MCAICGSRQGAQADERHVRHLKCWKCGKEFTQTGPGRNRLVCDDPKCNAARHRYRQNGYAALDRWVG